MGLDSPATIPVEPFRPIATLPNFPILTFPINPNTSQLTTHEDIAAWHPSGKAFAVALSGSPFLIVLKTDPDTGEVLDRYPNPAALPTATTKVNSVQFSPDGLFLLIATDTTPFVEAYHFALTTGLGAKVAPPAVVPGGTTANSARFNYPQDRVAVGSDGGDFIQMYIWSPAGFGAKQAAPAAKPLDAVSHVIWTPKSGGNEDILVALNPVAIGIEVLMAWPVAAGAFGVKYAQPPFNASNILGLTVTSLRLWPVINPDLSFDVIMNLSANFPSLGSVTFLPGTGWDHLAIGAPVTIGGNLPGISSQGYVSDGSHGIITSASYNSGITDTNLYSEEYIPIATNITLPPGMGSVIIPNPAIITGLSGGLWRSPNGKFVGSLRLERPYLATFTWLQ
jgi:hypothetical protein